ncbi:hypothetical protein [Cerasicoccus maritimus]|uniref:hypothetical protein n=1 Tax=Cerasicoccus maritimus TaxID=490089 RepID=UPI002852730D|nr:hypothetical protein [Cerasicoccus maritimus]
MFKHLFRWLYHRRQRRAAHDRLHGRRKLIPKFRRFTNSAFERATFGKYDHGGISRWKAVLIYLPVSGILLWIVFESFRALTMFQP